MIPIEAARGQIFGVWSGGQGSISLRKVRIGMNSKSLKMTGPL
jgi:hypothetical protein